MSGRDQDALHYINLWVTDTLAHIFRTGEPPEVTGARLRLWLVSCTESPVGTLPDDMDQLARWSGLDADAMRTHYERITSAWTKRGGRWSIRRIVEQYDAVSKRRVQATKAAKSRWGKIDTGHATAMRPQCMSNANAMPS